MRVLHIDVERGWRGGQVQLAHLLERAPGPVEVCHDGPGLVRALRRFRPDVVAAHSPRSHQLALLQPRPLVVHRRVDFRPRGIW
ncbi:MAG: hypothetical protein KC656_16010, partial [Myxococcales bacterium]|nr:hypothetical protein [Myxococcales bacterium]